MEIVPKLDEMTWQMDDLDKLINALMNRLGRLPTEEEIMVFIKGNDFDRLVIWNMEK